MGSDNYCLKWNDFESNMSSSFVDLRSKEEFFDVTLSCDHGNSQMQAHKVILAACSPFFRRVLARNPHQNPLIYLKGVDYENLEAVLNFMYQGEVNVAQEDINEFLRVAVELDVKGLSPGLTDGSKNGSSEKQTVKKLAKKPMPAAAAAATAGAMKRPPQLQPAPNLIAKPVSSAAAAAASSVPAMPSSPSSSALNNSSHNSQNAAKKPKLSTEERLQVVKPDIENNIEEASPEDIEDYGGFGEGYEGAYLDDSMAADEMEMGMGPGLEGDGTKEIGMDCDPVDYYRRDDQGVFWCANCPLKTPHKRDLLRHIDAVHLDTQYPCYLCGRVLKAKYLLERHTKKVHQKNRPKIG